MSLLEKLHSIKILRHIAKKIFVGFPIKQNFYNGKIYMDAVEHSWAWTGTRRYESFDKDLQDKIYQLSLTKSKFIDIGSNIGAISLAILLRNKHINVIAIEPNPAAIKYFNKSLKANKLANRCEIIEAVVSSNDIEKKFDPSGSVIGHIVNEGGLTVKSIIFWDFITNMAISAQILVKVDIEGFETDILNYIPNNIEEIRSLTLIFELHPKGFNGVGDPNFCIKQLNNAGLTVFDFDDHEIKEVNENEFSQIIVKN